MILSDEQIRGITLGALDVRRENGLIRFIRMTDGMTAAFTAENKAFYDKCFASAGVRLDLDTDSERFDFAVADVKPGSSRKWMSFDLYVDGTLYAHFYEPDYTASPRYEYRCLLPAGGKRVQLFFPFGVNPGLEYVELSDGCALTAHVPPLTAVCYGDSITQGYDTRFPSMSYVNVAARLLDCDVHNAGVGGARFNADSAEIPTGKKADFATVAFGTNDWTVLKSREEYAQNCDAFLKKLKTLWGETPVFVILPIWRGDADEPRPSGTFSEVRALIRETAEKYGFFVLDDLDLVPHLEEFYMPDIVHPNDAGFYSYGVRLANFIKEKL